MMQQFPQLTEDLTRDTHSEHVRLTRDWLVLFAMIGAGAVAIAAMLGAAVTLAAPLWVVLPLLVGFGFAAIIAMIALRTLEYARYCLQTRFSEWQANQGTARDVVKIQATQITNVQVKGRSNVVSVNSQGQAVESVRLVPLASATPVRMIDGIAEQDLLHFIERALVIGHSKRAWLGAQLPSGRMVSTFEDYDQLVAPLVKCKVIDGRGERSAGHFTTDNAQEIAARLGLSGPQIDGAEVKQVG